MAPQPLLGLPLGLDRETREADPQPEVELAPEASLPEVDTRSVVVTQTRLPELKVVSRPSFAEASSVTAAPASMLTPTPNTVAMKPDLKPISVSTLAPVDASTTPTLPSEVHCVVPFSWKAEDPSPGGSCRIRSGKASVVTETNVAVRGRTPFTTTHSTSVSGARPSTSAIRHRE